MNVDLILSTFNRHHADCILIGGMNFFIVHQPVSTFDVDLWVADTPSNLTLVHQSLSALDAEVSFSPKGDDWQRVSSLNSPDWVRRAAVFCLNSPHGAIDIFREVRGLEEGFDSLKIQCPQRTTSTGVPFRSLSDELMIRCQLALPETERKLDRLRALGHLCSSRM
ncbi:MAG: hypothetical protein EXS31_17110 [Pedosphaera sp.]|nr:hypothetical protein [Pedosphaera sp.]